MLYADGRQDTLSNVSINRNCLADIEIIISDNSVYGKSVHVNIGDLFIMEVEKMRASLMSATNGQSAVQELRKWAKIVESYSFILYSTANRFEK